jgi:hypothetical protein
VDASAVVIGAEFLEFSVKVDRIPEERVVQISRRIVPISRSTNGCDVGAYGTDLISSTSRIRKFASHR